MNHKMVFPSDQYLGASQSPPELYVQAFSSAHTSPSLAFSSVMDSASSTFSSPMMPGSQFTPPFTPTPQFTANQQAVLDLFELDESLPDEDDEMADDADDVVDLDDQNRRVEKLRALLPTAQQLWWAKSQQMAAITEKLANGSRDPKWRRPIGISGVLDFYLNLLSQQNLAYDLKLHTLRLIGNACADTDQNRERIVARNYMGILIQQLRDTSLLPFAIPVLFNVCVDYEPAQKQASESYLSRELIELAASPRFGQHRAFLGYICQLLDLMITQPGEIERAPEDLAVVLFTVIADREAIDLDAFVATISTAVAYLEHARFQQALVRQTSLDCVLMLMMDSYTRFDESTASISYPSGVSQEAQNENAKLLTQLRNNLNQVLSDVSALPEFAAAYPVICPTTSFLRRWISSPQRQLQVCACIMLGNLARSDRMCEEFVHVSQVHMPLIHAISESNDQQVLHAALGFLKNLALPACNKDILGDAGLVAALPRLWALDTLPQIQYASVSLARVLVTGSWMNVQRICSPLSADPDSPAHDRSQLSPLIALFSRADAEPIKMEIARLLTAICRAYCTPNPAIPNLDQARHGFFETHRDLVLPLAFMISQKKWPAIRSEGWFVFALMARTSEGAFCVSEIMHDMGVFQPLVELLTGKSFVDGKIITPEHSPVASPESSMHRSPAHSRNPSQTLSQTGQGQTSPNLSPAFMNTGAGNTPEELEMRRVDRENALVLVKELLSTRGHEMAIMRRSVLEDLLKGGSALHAGNNGSQGELFNGGLGWGNPRG